MSWNWSINIYELGLQFKSLMLQIHNVGNFITTRKYLPGTNNLMLTLWGSESKVFILTLMPLLSCFWTTPSFLWSRSSTEGVGVVDNPFPPNKLAIALALLLPIGIPRFPLGVVSSIKPGGWLRIFSSICAVDRRVSGTIVSMSGESGACSASSMAPAMSSSVTSNGTPKRKYIFIKSNFID